MGRIRTIKPEITGSKSLAKCSRDARLLYVWLFTVADDRGRFEADPVLLRASLFPRDEDVTAGMVVTWLDELRHRGKVRLYHVGDDEFGDITGWVRHQRIDKPQGSRIPSWEDRDMAEDSLLILGSFAESSPNGSGAIPERSESNRRSDQGSGIMDHGSISATKVASSNSQSVSSEIRSVWDAWLASTGRDRCKLDPKRRGIIERAVRSHGLDDCLDAVRGWVNDPWPERAQRNDVRYLLADAERIEKFRDLARNGRPTAGAVALSNPLDARLAKTLAGERA